MSTEQQVYHLWMTMFSRYLNRNDDRWFTDWKQARLHLRGVVEIKAKIRELLEAGYRVKTGYFATNVRGHREHVILYQNKTPGASARTAEGAVSKTEKLEGAIPSLATTPL